MLAIVVELGHQFLFLSLFLHFVELEVLLNLALADDVSVAGCLLELVYAIFENFILESELLVELDCWTLFLHLFEFLSENAHFHLVSSNFLLVFQPLVLEFVGYFLEIALFVKNTGSLLLHLELQLVAQILQKFGFFF